MIRLGLDNDDGAILRWFIEFQVTGKMDEERGPDGKTYFWIKYPRIVLDLPLLKISPETVARRLLKMAKAGVLLHYHHKAGGSFSMYRMGPEFECLVSSPPARSNAEGQRQDADRSADERVPPARSNADQNTLSSSKDSKKKEEYPQDSHPLILATLLMTEHRKTDEKFLIGKERDTLQRWAADIDKLIRLDKRTPDEIRRVIVWSQSPGCFWVSNILSGAKLREKFSQLIGQVSGARTVTKLSATAYDPSQPQVVERSM